MSNYGENSVVTAAVNGLHNNINREDESLALKAGVSYLKLLKSSLHVNFPV